MSPRRAPGAPGTRIIHLSRALSITQNISADRIAVRIRVHRRGRFHKWADHLLALDHASLSPATGCPLENRRWIPSDHGVLLGSRRRAVRAETRVGAQWWRTGGHQSKERLVLQATLPQMSACTLRRRLETVCPLLGVLFTHSQHEVSTLKKKVVVLVVVVIV